jgi:signal peptidase I
MTIRAPFARRAWFGLVILAGAIAGCENRVRAIEKSMEPTIRSGDLVRLDEHAYDQFDPSIGDIVSLTAPVGAAREMCGVPRPRESPCPRPTRALATGEQAALIKRIVAGPGTKVAISASGEAVVEGRNLFEPYAQPCVRPGPQCGLPRAIRVPPDHWFVLGDNRPYSSDSRHWGPVPRRAIDGRIDVARSLADQ